MTHHHRDWKLDESALRELQALDATDIHNRTVHTRSLPFPPALPMAHHPVSNPLQTILIVLFVAGIGAALIGWRFA